MGFPGGSASKESACNAGAAGNKGSIPGLGRSPGGGHGSPLQYSYLENPIGRRAWWVLSMGFSRQEYWSGLPCPPPGDLPSPGMEAVTHVSCVGRWVPYRWHHLGRGMLLDCHSVTPGLCDAVVIGPLLVASCSLQDRGAMPPFPPGLRARVSLIYTSMLLECEDFKNQRLY